jgi:hypothetical protein
MWSFLDVQKLLGNAQSFQMLCLKKVRMVKQRLTNEPVANGQILVGRRRENLRDVTRFIEIPTKILVPHSL